MSPPQLLSVSFSPQEVNTSVQAAQITLELVIMDDISGVAQCHVYVDPPVGTGSDQLSVTVTASDGLYSGSLTDGVLRTLFLWPKLRPFGIWKLSRVYCQDFAGRVLDTYSRDLVASGIYTFINQTGRGDQQAPQILNVTIWSSSVNTSNSQALISASLTFSDEVCHQNQPFT